jgi:hypothetical protein
MEPLLILVASGALLILALIVWGIQRRRAGSQVRHESLLSLGFAPVESPDPAVVERIERLAARGSLGRGVPRQVRLEKLHRRPLARGALYLFDLVAYGSGETERAEDVVAVISPTLDLPWMALVSLPQMGSAAQGLLGGLAEQAINWALSRSGMQRCDFSHAPLFDQRYAVLCRDEETARAFLDDSRTYDLARLERSYWIETAGDIFTLKGGLATIGASNQPQNLETLVEDAKRILLYLKKQPGKSS